MILREKRGKKIVTEKFRAAFPTYLAAAAALIFSICLILIQPADLLANYCGREICAFWVIIYYSEAGNLKLGRKKSVLN